MARTVETELRIELICDLMRQWAYDKNARKRLAAEWSVSEDWVTDLAVVARDRVLGEYDPNQMKLDAAMALRMIMLQSMRSDDPKERSNAIKAADTLAKLTGANAPVKSEVKVSGDDQQLAGRLASLIAGGPSTEDPGKPDGGGAPEG